MIKWKIEVEFMNHILECNNSQVKKIISSYDNNQKESKNETVLFFAKTDFFSITIYNSNKVMFQGKDAQEEYNMWCIMFDLKPENKTKKKSIEISSSDYFSQSIGSDEVGTGDFFGPVVVCAAYLTGQDIEFVKGLKIDDSKKITDERIRVIGQQLKDRIQYSMLALHNSKFNEMTKKGYNMNKLKAYLHNSAILQLVNKIKKNPLVIVDQFAEEKLYFSYLKNEHKIYRDITFTTKAESKYASVAVASIIARYAFLQYFDNLSEESGYELLKGAGKKVDFLAAQIIKEKGEKFLYNISKTNFRTLDKAKDILIEK